MQALIEWDYGKRHCYILLWFVGSFHSKDRVLNVSSKGITNWFSRFSQLIRYYQLKFIVKSITMSKKTQLPNPTHNTNKDPLISDIVAFFSVISGYVFLSFTLQYNVLQGILGLSLNSINDIALIYIFYAVLVILLKLIALTIHLFKKEDTQVVKSINQTVYKSLYHLFIIVTLLVITSPYGKTLEVAYLCHISIWIFAAHTNIILCNLFKGVSVLNAIGLFGYSIQVIIFFGQMLRFVDIDFFEFL